jgi:vitellogenic carboxypeptidase-like protein
VTKSYAADVAYILGKVRTLVYNGQNDVVVNTPGVLQYLNGLSWHGASQWKRKQKTPWRIGGVVKGWAKVHDNLWFVLVNGAGHMVPTDQPLASYAMMEHFIHHNNNWDL